MCRECDQCENTVSICNTIQCMMKINNESCFLKSMMACHFFKIYLFIV